MKTFFAIFLFCTCTFLQAQKYFQQEVNYVINVKLDDYKNILHANESVEYINNSPDTLKEIYFHLWPNAYKNKYTAYAKQQSELRRSQFLSAESKQLGYIDSLNFKINNVSIKWELDSINIDICKLILPEPLLPGKKVIISTPFRVKIPFSFSRLGHWGQQYQITQWYPKPAVYDKNGWNAMPYLDMGEFYSELGSFEVNITIPKNYVVAATGNLQTISEYDFLEKLSDETKQNQYLKNIQKPFPPTSSEWKTICYKEKNIHDFAWFADKRYHVIKGEVILPHSKRKVTTWVYFSDYQAELWKNAVKYVNDAVYYYSLWLGDYPYDNCTAVEGALGAGGGMEYPTITNIGWSADTLSLENVIVHEVGHNWFYGILANNERTNPWLDEGINSFYEKRYMLTKYPNLKCNQLQNEPLLKHLELNKFPFGFLEYFAYTFVAGLDIDQSSDLKSEDYLPVNYGAIVYMKNAVLFYYLMKYLGEEEFDLIMKKYYEQWKFRHPQPSDLETIFKENTDQDLSWFFNDLLSTTKKIDYKIVSVKKGLDPLSFTGDCWDVTIKNCGEVAAPFPISAIENDSIIGTKWIEGFSGKKIIKLHWINFDKLIIDASWIVPEIKRNNNTIRKKGILKKTEPVQFKFLGNIENPNFTNINFIPAIGWNNYNKTMLGVLFYNSVLPEKKLEYQLMPLFSFVKKNIAGATKIKYTGYFKNGPIRKIDFSTAIIQYAYEHEKGNNFQRLKSGANLQIRKKDVRDSKETNLKIEEIIASDIVFKPGNYNFYTNITILHNNPRIFYPYSINLSNQGGKSFLKSTMEINYKVNYNNPRKGLFIRAFAGYFFYNKTSNPLLNFRLSGANGIEDYTFDEPFLARTEYLQADPSYLFSHQFIKNDGGFAFFSPWAQSNSWLWSLGLSSSIPSPAPLRFFANFGGFPTVDFFTPKQFFIAETGIELKLIPDIFSIYFPLWMSKDLKTTNEIHTPEYFQKVRFTLNLNNLNLFEQRKKLPELFY